MTYRVVRGLAWARLVPKGQEPFPPTRRRKGAKALGLRYEKAFAKALSPLGALHGQWIEYLDAGGKGYAQPDFLIDLPGEVIVLETKLTAAEQGRGQMAELYRPLLASIFAKPVREIVVVRGLTAEPRLDLVRTTLWEALELARILAVAPTLHWREGFPLGIKPPSHNSRALQASP